MRWAANRAAGLITASRALKATIAQYGLDLSPVCLLRNGVDLELFRPLDRLEARRRLAVEPPVLLSVGNLLPLKGHDLVTRALARLPRATLLIAGQGPEEPRLRSLARTMMVDDRVRLLGSIPHSELAKLYSAADVLILASEREGSAECPLGSYGLWHARRGLERRRHTRGRGRACSGPSAVGSRPRVHHRDGSCPAR